MSPTYINLVTIYSFSNISDVTWGSRPAGVANETSKEDKGNIIILIYYLFKALENNF